MTMREKQELRDRARATLEQIIRRLAFMSPQVGSRFKTSHKGTVLNINHLDSLPSPMSKELAPLKKRLSRVAEATYRAVSSGTTSAGVAPADLDILTDALDADARRRPRERIRLHQDGTYRRVNASIETTHARLVFDYLNLIQAGVVVHSKCQLDGCGSIMTTGRGPKRFCSKECREEFWSYQNQKQYYEASKQRSAANKERRKNVARKERKK